MSEKPKTVGPYSLYRVAGDFVYLSGQLGLDPNTGKFVGNSAKEQAVQSLENIKKILEELGLSMNNVVKTLVLLNDINDYKDVNEVYASYFEAPFPARSAFAVDKLPLGGLVEIEVIAYKG